MNEEEDEYKKQEDEYKKLMEETYEIDNRAAQIASEQYLKSTEYTNHLLEASNKVNESIANSLFWIIIMLILIFFAINALVFEPWWK